MSAPVMRIDPNPCERYRWPAHIPCPNVWSGSHCCGRKAPHPGACVCAYCGRRGRGKDLARAAGAETGGGG